MDDNNINNHIPLNEIAFHFKNKGNNDGIGIEICMHKGINQNKANENAAKLVGLLCRKLNISIEDIVPHKFWYGKNCPKLLLKEWPDFILSCSSYYGNPSRIDIENSDSIEENENAFLSEKINIEGIEFNFQDCHNLILGCNKKIS